MLHRATEVFVAHAYQKVLYDTLLQIDRMQEGSYFTTASQSLTDYASVVHARSNTVGYSAVGDKVTSWAIRVLSTNQNTISTIQKLRARGITF